MRPITTDGPEGEKVQVPSEALVQVFVNRGFLSSLLCTPRDLPELVVGWLYNQGYIDSVDEVVAVDTCEHNRKVYVDLTTERYREMGGHAKIRTSACVGGEISSFQFTRRRSRLIKGPCVHMERIQLLMKQTLRMGSEYRRTGGIHCASLASGGEGKILVFFEDIGRHNAVDKVVGRMLLTKQPPDDLLLLTSGRISSEMALKAAHSGVSIVASITTCTDLAIEVAEEAGLTIINRTLQAPVAACGADRIQWNGQPKQRDSSSTASPFQSGSPSFTGGSTGGTARQGSYR